MSGGLDVVTRDYDQRISVGPSARYDKIDPSKLAEITATTYGRDSTPDVVGAVDTSKRYLNNIQFTDSSLSIAAPGTKGLAPKLETAVDQIEKACNGGLTGIGTDKESLWNTLSPLTKEEYAKVNERFAEKYGAKYASRGEKWDVQSELKDELGDADLARFNRMIADKGVNNVPEEFRTTGESLLKPGSNLKVGEMNRVSLPDGRDYDVYIPRNADSRAPVIVGTSAAGLGTMKGVMAVETGLTAEAEKTGSIVVIGYPNVRNLNHMDIATWNIPDRTNLSRQTDSYDDRAYLDNVLNDLGKRSQTAEKVGLIGFADGARFAEAYAADRPDKVAGVVSMSGTWMEGDRKPVKGLPVMIIHGDSDGTFNYSGNKGIGSSLYNNVFNSNFDKSRPDMQAKVWSAAGGGDGTITERKTLGDVEQRTYNAGTVEVKEYILKGGESAVHDYKNNGSRFWQWMLGRPDMRHDFVSKGADFLKQHIVSDVSVNPRQRN